MMIMIINRKSDAVPSMNTTGKETRECVSFFMEIGQYVQDEVSFVYFRTWDKKEERIL